MLVYLLVEQQKELNRTYLRIGFMFLAWGFMIALRAMIVIPDEPAPKVYEYHRPEKKIEKKVDQRDTLYLISGDWIFPFNFQAYNYPFYGCGGVIYVDQWGNPGYGFPSWGDNPLGGVVKLPGADSARTDSLVALSKDSMLNAALDSSKIYTVNNSILNLPFKKDRVNGVFKKLSRLKNNWKTRRERRSE